MVVLGDLNYMNVENRKVSFKISANGLHWRSAREFVACLPGADDELKRKVETIE